MRCNDYVKTVEGRSTVESGAVFCIEATLWQGYGATAIMAPEDNCTDEEMARVKDIDGTLDQVWKKRHGRLEGRYERKMAEYDDRRRKLREQRNALVGAIRQAKEEQLPVSPADLAEIQRIDRRLENLLALGQAKAVDTAQAASVDPSTIKRPPGRPPKFERSA